MLHWKKKNRLHPVVVSQKRDKDKRRKCAAQRAQHDLRFFGGGGGQQVYERIQSHWIEVI